MEFGSVTRPSKELVSLFSNLTLNTHSARTLNTHTPNIQVPNFWDSIVRYKTETGGFGLNKLILIRLNTRRRDICRVIYNDSSKGSPTADQTNSGTVRRTGCLYLLERMSKGDVTSQNPFGLFE
jgi:hypothetical protein